MKRFLILFFILAGTLSPGADDKPPAASLPEIEIFANSHSPRLGRQVAGRLNRGQLTELKSKYYPLAVWNRGGSNLFRLATVPTTVEYPEFYASVLDDMIRVATEGRDKLLLAEIKKVLGTELLFMYRAFLTALENNSDFRIVKSHGSDPTTIRLYRELKGKTPKAGETLVPEGFAHLRLFSEFFTWLGATDTRRPRTLWEYCEFFDEFMTVEKHVAGFLIHVNTWNTTWKKSGGLNSLLRHYRPTLAQSCAAGFALATVLGLNLYAFRGDFFGNNVPNKGDVEKRAGQEPDQKAPAESNDAALDKMYEKLADDITKQAKP